MGKKDKPHGPSTCGVVELLYSYRKGEQDALRARAAVEKAELVRKAAAPTDPEPLLSGPERQKRDWEAARARIRLPLDVQAELPFSLANMAAGAFTVKKSDDHSIALTAEELLDYQRMTMPFMVSTARDPTCLSTGKADLTAEVLDKIESFPMDTEMIQKYPKAPKKTRRMCDVEVIRFAENPFCTFTMEQQRDRFVDPTVVVPDPNQPVLEETFGPNTMLDLLEQGPVELPHLPTAAEISACMKVNARIPTFTFVTNLTKGGSVCLNSGFLMIMPKLYKPDKTVRGYVVMPRLIEAPVGYGITTPLMGRDCDNMGPFNFSFTTVRPIPAGSRFVVQLICLPAEAAPTGMKLLNQGEAQLFKPTDSDNARVVINPAIQVQFHKAARDEKNGMISARAASSAVVQFTAPTLVLSRSRESHASAGVTSAGYFNPLTGEFIAPAMLGQFDKLRASLPNSHVAVVLEKKPSRGLFSVKVSTMPEDGSRLLCGIRVWNGFFTFMNEFHQQYEGSRGVAKFSGQLGGQANELINNFATVYNKLEDDLPSTSSDPNKPPPPKPTRAEICAGLMRLADYSGTVVAEKQSDAIRDDVALYNAYKGSGRSRGLYKKLAELVNCNAFKTAFAEYKARMKALSLKTGRKRPISAEDSDDDADAAAAESTSEEPSAKAARIEVPTGFYREADAPPAATVATTTL
jgi:hypothetical protein